MDVTTKYEDYANLGYEFLTTCYYLANTKSDINFEIGKKVVFAKFVNDKIYEKTTISGEESDTYSGELLISEGAYIVEMQVVMHIDKENIPIYIKGKDFNFSGLKMPKKNKDEETDEQTEFILRFDYINSIMKEFNNMFAQFIKIRVSDKWEDIRKNICEYALNTNTKNENN